MYTCGVSANWKQQQIAHKLPITNIQAKFSEWLKKTNKQTENRKEMAIEMNHNKQ